MTLTPDEQTALTAALRFYLAAGPVAGTRETRRRVAEVLARIEESEEPR